MKHRYSITLDRRLLPNFHYWKGDVSVLVSGTGIIVAIVAAVYNSLE